MAYPWGDVWNDASMKDCLKYVRGSKRLSLPDEWRVAFDVSAFRIPHESVEESD